MFVNSFRCLVLTIWYGGRPRTTSFWLSSEILLKIILQKCAFPMHNSFNTSTCYACKLAVPARPRRHFLPRPLIHGGSRRVPRKPPHLSPQTPQPDSENVPTMILMHYRRITSYTPCQYVLKYLLIVGKIHVNDYARRISRPR